MDTTKEFILQCEKAVEIQKNRDKNPDIGDIVHDKRLQFPSIVLDLDEYYDDATWRVKISCDNVYADTRDLIWLPRQDQLQGMVNTYTRQGYILVRFYKFYKSSPEYFKERIYYSNLGWSMEQLWLGFVMSEKYNKTWNGKDWETTNV